METWTAAFMLLGNQFKDLGLKGDEGVEKVLRDSFASKGKPIGELETNVEQLGFFDKLPGKRAARSCSKARSTSRRASTPSSSRCSVPGRRGDVNAIARTFNRDLGSSPELKQALIDRRNANWSRWIEQRMAQPGAIMIAVGAGHLAGKDSVIDMLQRGGYQVRRLQ